MIKGTNFPHEGARLQRSRPASRWLRPRMVELRGGFLSRLSSKTSLLTVRKRFAMVQTAENRSAEWNCKLQQQKEFNVKKRE